MRFECTIFFKGDSHEVSANCYVDYDGIGRRWIAVEDIQFDTLPDLTRYEQQSVEELIAAQYDIPYDPRD